MIDKKYIDKVLDEVDLAEVVSDYGVKLQLRGHTAKGCCPFHQEDTPSFHVDTAKNLYHCFGCGKGGNVINFVMEQDGLTFPLAVKKLMKEKLHIDLSDSDLQSTPEEEERYKKLESMRIINERLCAFFCQEIGKETPDAKSAKAYMLSRWNEEYCKEKHIGYAPDNWTSVIDYAKKEGLSLELMQEMGILKLSEKTHSVYCVYRNRIMIPIRDRYSHIEGFTARAIDDKSDCKYLNSADSDLYCKSRSIFGIDTAIKKARGDRKLYLVEGAPDVMKLQSVGIFNAIASLGGSWTVNQFQKLKDYRLQDCTLCFIPDSDIPKDKEELGAGFCNVIHNGALAMRQGFTVSVKEIPNDLSVEQPKKIDPDEFFTDKADLAKLEEREFLLWAFEKRFNKNGTTEEKQKAIDETCELLLCIKDEAILERYITALAKIDGNKTIWLQALNTAMKKRRKQLSEKNNEGYFAKLRNEYLYLAHMYSLLPLDGKQWKPMGKGSNRYPHPAFSFLANMYYQRKTSLQSMLACETAKEVTSLLNVSATPYWQPHSHFGVTGKTCAKHLSTERLNLTVINAVVPMLFAYGREMSKEVYCDRAFDLIEQCKAETNAITKHWEQYGIKTETAGDSQATTGSRGKQKILGSFFLYNGGKEIRSKKEHRQNESPKKIAFYLIAHAKPFAVRTALSLKWFPSFHSIIFSQSSSSCIRSIHSPTRAMTGFLAFGSLSPRLRYTLLAFI